MCGFCGFLGQRREKNSRELLSTMLETMSHRGPDEEDSYLDDRISLGFKRLKVIDLETGKQPMSNEDKNLWLVCNGEIYNYKELRKELQAKGHCFRSQSDAEVILHLYEEIGEGCLEKLRGMFSFVLWDSKQEIIFAARDRFGIKPFFYFYNTSILAFASETKALLKLPYVSREGSETSFSHYLTYQYVPEPATIYKDIFKLPPAHYFLCRPGEKPQPKRYWQAAFQPVSKPLSQLTEECRFIIQETVDLHLASDVPLGAFLSGGIDSSITAALAAKKQPLQTFSVGYAETDYSELAEARTTARYLGTEHHEQIITPEDFLQYLPHLVWYLDEPVADPAAMALFFVAQMAAKKITVTLSGEGADEVFGGYDIYREASSLATYEKLPSSMRRVLYKASERILPQGMPGKSFLARGYIPLENRYFGNAFLFDTQEKREILSPEIKPVDPQLVTAPLFEEASGYDEVTKMKYIDIHTWMPGDILVKADKMTMANSLELRVPFLDHKVFEFAATIPTEYKVFQGQTKYLLRQAFKYLLPEEVVNRPKKGFPVPTRLWLKEKKFQKYFQELLTIETAPHWINRKKAQELYREHLMGKKDNSRKLWALFVFLTWLRIGS